MPIRHPWGSWCCARSAASRTVSSGPTPRVISERVNQTSPRWPPLNCLVTSKRSTTGGAAVAAREVLHGADERVRAARVRHPVRVIGTQLGQGIGVGGVEAAAFLGEPEDRPQTRELVREFQDLVVEDARLPAPGHVDQHDVVVRPARHEGPQHGHHRGDPGTGHHEQQFCGGVREQELSFGAFQVEHVARGGALNDVFGHQALRFDGDRRVTVFGGADGVRTPDPLPVHFHADPRPLPRPVRDPPSPAVKNRVTVSGVSRRTCVMRPRV